MEKKSSKKKVLWGLGILFILLVIIVIIYFVIGYEKAINSYVSDIKKYNENIKDYNDVLEENDTKIEEVKLTTNYIDVDGDRKYLGKN